MLLGNSFQNHEAYKRETVTEESVILSEVGRVSLKRLYSVRSLKIECNRAKHEVCEGRRKCPPVRVDREGGFTEKTSLAWVLDVLVGVRSSAPERWAAAPNSLRPRALFSPVPPGKVPFPMSLARGLV